MHIDWNLWEKYYAVICRNHANLNHNSWLLKVCVILLFKLVSPRKVQLCTFHSASVRSSFVRIQCTWKAMRWLWHAQMSILPGSYSYDNSLVIHVVCNALYCTALYSYMHVDNMRQVHATRRVKSTRQISALSCTCIILGLYLLWMYRMRGHCFDRKHRELIHGRKYGEWFQAAIDVCDVCMCVWYVVRARKLYLLGASMYNSWYACSGVNWN